MSTEPTEADWLEGRDNWRESNRHEEDEEAPEVPASPQATSDEGTLEQFLADFWWACESGEPEGTRKVRVSDGDRNLAGAIEGSKWFATKLQKARAEVIDHLEGGDANGMLITPDEARRHFGIGASVPPGNISLKRPDGSYKTNDEIRTEAAAIRSQEPPTGQEQP